MMTDRIRATVPLMALTILFFATTCPAPRAEMRITPADPWEIIHVVRAATRAKVGRDAFRDPVITATAPGGDLGYRMVFHGCHFGRGCTAMLLVMRLVTPEGHRPPTLANLAEWNGAKLIGRAGRDGQGRAVLEHPVILGAGLPAETLSQTLDAWHLAMAEFAQHVEFRRK